MRLEDVGYNLKTGWHDRRLTHAESVFVGVLWVDHVGEKLAISADELAKRFAFGMGVSIELDRKTLEYWKRDIRELQNHILEKHDQIPVLSKPGKGGGYWIAADDSEKEEFYHSFRKRGLTGFIKATRGKRAGVVEAVEQIAFEFEDLVDQTGEAAMELKRLGPSIAPDIVDALLSKMSMNPEEFASSLRKIREKYFSGGVLVEKNRIEAMRNKINELNEMTASFGA